MKINLEKKRLDGMSENNIEISYIKLDNDNIMINKQFDCVDGKNGVRKLSFNSNNHQKQIKSSSGKNLNRHKSLYSKSEKKTSFVNSKENSLDNFDSTELIFISDEYINKITKQENVIIISDRKMLGKTKSVELLKYQAKDRERRSSLNKLSINKNNICDTEERNTRSCKKVIIKINNSKEKSGSQDIKVICNTSERFGMNILLLGLETYEEPIMLEVKKLEKKIS